MHRIDTKTAQKDKFGAGKNGFTRGNPQTGTPATDLDDDYFDMLQEELCSVVEASGASLEKERHDQLLTALRALLLSRKNPFGDIKSDGTVKTALANLDLGDTNGYVGRKIAEQWITSSKTVTLNPLTKRIKVTLTGGGGGGGGAFNSGAPTDNFSGAGGAAGATGIKWFNVADITNFAVVIGAGGTEATKGGNSTFSGMVATGGNPSTASTVYASGGVGVAGSGGDVNLAGGDGGDGQSNTRFLNGYGGSSFWGGSRRAGQCTVSSPIIAKALVPGGGGAGAYDTQVFSTRFYGGEGADGICLVEEFA